MSGKWDIWQANIHEGKTNRCPASIPSDNIPVPRFNNATAEHATMAGLMKDVGASYGCHNSAQTGRCAVMPAKSVGLYFHVCVSLYTCMTSDSHPAGGPTRNRGWKNSDERG